MQKSIQNVNTKLDTQMNYSCHFFIVFYNNGCPVLIYGNETQTLTTKSKQRNNLQQAFPQKNNGMHPTRLNTE